ncbi:hypothetical protein BDV36DRAFT_292362 [Aspergillus pseudocaelatus]|uniref:F-box domain-containing protein n=1 Tax=Aspergillus pseudocaelatus TaxID=1825620 RepID=A0ABQ6WWG3_9EURO|nr:hypothetical protein BDV36DRAFT_292362 [Aspergillus pseudocaelatus]
MPYCDREHQTLDLPWHQATCMAVKRSCIWMEQIEGVLCYHGHTLFIDANQPSGWHQTPWYMTARLNLIHALSRIKHVESAQAQLRHFMDMFELCGYNHAGEWAGIPALMLRINKDQECYDFVKWWHTVCGSYGDNVPLPSSLCFNVTNADAFERLDLFSDRFANSRYIVALTLLKVKLLLDIRKLDQVVFALGAIFPREILDMILSYVPRSSVVARNCRALNDEARQKLVHELETQVDILFREVKKRDPFLWWKLASRSSVLDARYSEPPTSRHVIDTVALSLMFNHTVWLETPGATDFIKAKLVGSVCR